LLALIDALQQSFDLTPLRRIDGHGAPDLQRRTAERLQHGAGLIRSSGGADNRQQRVETNQRDGHSGQSDQKNGSASRQTLQFRHGLLSFAPRT